VQKGYNKTAEAKNKIAELIREHNLKRVFYTKIKTGYKRYQRRRYDARGKNNNKSRVEL
jgi:hypothetical protein